MPGPALVALAALLWSLGGVMIKILTRDHGVAPETLACLRSASAGLALAWALPALRLHGRVGIAALVYAILVGTFVKATTDTTAANAIFLQYLYPLIVAVFARERLSPGTVAALVLGTAGVVVIVAGSWTPDNLTGISLGLVSAFAFASFVLLQHGAPKDADPIALSSFYNLVAAAALLPFATFRGLSAVSLGLIAATGVVQLGVPYGLFIKGLKTTSATDAALIALLEPILNPVWVWIFHGEEPGVWTMVGGAALCVALAVKVLGSRATAA